MTKPRDLAVHLTLLLLNIEFISASTKLHTEYIYFYFLARPSARPRLALFDSYFHVFALNSILSDTYLATSLRIHHFYLKKNPKQIHFLTSSSLNFDK
jgi:hypothetical protein